MAVTLNIPLFAHYQADLAQANDPQMRLFMVEDNVEAASPRLDVKGQWKLCTPETAGTFSAAGYFFGRDLRAARKQPVGLICNAASGSPAEAWIERAAMAADPRIAPYLAAWEKQWPAYVPVRAEFNAKIAAWIAAKAQAAAGQPEPPAPPPPPIMASIRTIPWIPGCFRNGILAPLMPYALHGVAWYQGESNTFRSAHYGATLRLMIRDWRAGFGQPELPFLIVQLPAWEPDAANGGPFNWAQVREGQLQALAEPRTALITTLDLNDDKDLHPRNKLDVGRRLALAARGVAYGESLEYAGPLVESVNVRGARVQVRFTHAEGGLVAKPGPELVDPKLTGFELAGADGRYFPAQASIKGDTVVLTAPEVPKPATVRYAFANQPAFSLYNAAGLPASPFRTDTRIEAPDVKAP